ncbi:MAG: ribosome small subunit-dependent GTPase A [Coriobacteriales bacterium]|jgi:ribosome biogenesis GTPase|nr:ribosome small subunit-dependent GTPase A [Coriobacteriales bacterium]
MSIVASLPDAPRDENSFIGEKTAAPPPLDVCPTAQGRVVSLDRGYPLVRTAQGELRAQHSIVLVKNVPLRAAVGDVVELEFPPGQDIPLIAAINERHTVLARKVLIQSKHEGSGKYEEQILAANVDIVFVVQSLGNRPLNLDYLERQLVLACQSGAEVAVVLTKADLAHHLEADVAAAQGVAAGHEVIVESAVTGIGLKRVRRLLAADATAKESSTAPPHGAPRDTMPDGAESLPAATAGATVGATGVLLGKSGVGKSTLINALLGSELLTTGAVRAKDRAGRHTTVARKMVFLPSGGALIDAPGMRSVGLYEAALGLKRAFPEIVTHAAACRYRDCTHTAEPGCALADALSQGSIDRRRLDSYRAIAQEVFA